MHVLKTLPLFFLCCLPSSYAATPVTATLNAGECWTIQHDGVTAFQATGIAAQQPPYTTVNYTGTCSVPPPINDPNALNILIGKYTNHGCANFSTTTAQDFASTFGSATIRTWPYVPSTGVKITLPAHGTYYSAIIDPGQNPGITPHYVKGDQYAGSCGLSPTPGARVHVSVVPVGTGTAPTGRCDLPVAAFDGNAWIQLKFAGPVNTAHCIGQIGVSVRYKIENNGSAPITALLTYN